MLSNYNDDESSMMMLVSCGAIIFFASSPGCRWVLVGAVLIMGMVKKRCSRAGSRANGDVSRCRYSLSAKANFFEIGIKVAPSDSI